MSAITNCYARVRMFTLAPTCQPGPGTDGAGPSGSWPKARKNGQVTIATRFGFQFKPPENVATLA